MPVPEATVNEDRSLRADEREIGTAWDPARVQSITSADLPDKIADHELGSGVSAADEPHPSASLEGA